MAQIFPFKGIMYNHEKIDNIADVVAQPYDTITQNMQNDYYNQSEYNVTKIIKGKEYKDDTDKKNQYTRAGEYFKQWLEDKVLIQDEKSSIYIYEQIYKLPNGESRSRLSYIAICKLEDFESGVVLPHEYTHSKFSCHRYCHRSCGNDKRGNKISHV